VFKSGTIKYIALGDSYTICEGADLNESWPKLLAEHLNEKGIPVELIANPSVTGYTTQQLIEQELPLLQNSKVDFVTLLIGVNDWVRGIDTAMFAQNFSYILNEIERQISNKNQILIITIPDFGVTPTGARYSGGRDISKGITEFNTIILKEAAKRNLKTVDVFELSKGMRDDAGLVAKDGLHPSAKEYALWEKLILPLATSILKK
jgi:lysophospholipase L1-like esterase